MKITIESTCPSKGLYHLMITIRPETSKDIAAIRHLVEMAFGQTSEGRLVEALRQADPLIISLVAVEKEQIVGHIAFNAVFIESLHATANVVALVPLAGHSGSVKYHPEFELVSG
jgi:putative acetyltransferase